MPKMKKVNIIVITIQPIVSIAKGVVDDMGKKRAVRTKIRQITKNHNATSQLPLRRARMESIKKTSPVYHPSSLCEPCVLSLH